MLVTQKPGFRESTSSFQPVWIFTIWQPVLHVCTLEPPGGPLKILYFSPILKELAVAGGGTQVPVCAGARGGSTES